MSFLDKPGFIDRAVASWLQPRQASSLRENSGKLIETYRQGRNSSQIDVAAYVTARMPATYAAVRRVLAHVAAIAEGFEAGSVLDVGAGPGTASWAALAQWPNISAVTMIEADVRFIELARAVAKTSGIAALQEAKILKSKLDATDAQAELVIAAYVFAELEDRAAGEAALKLWAQCEHILVVVEPGTPRGFARIRNARAALLHAGANILGPCTHASGCPMSGKNWCHFTQRLARSREHMHAKAAHVPFEDEPFSWIAVSKQPYPLMAARIVAPPVTTKIGRSFNLCEAGGLTSRLVASRDKSNYKLLKKLEWGDGFPHLPN